MLTGFLPLLYSGSQVQAHPGDLLMPADQFSNLQGSLKCEINGDSKEAPFRIVAPGQIDKPLGQVFSIPLNLRFAIDSFDLDLIIGRVNRVTIKASILSPENGDDFVKSCLGSSDAKLAVSGSLSGKCVDFEPDVLAFLKIGISVNGTPKLSGDYKGLVNCGRLIIGNPNGGNCVTGTENKDNLIGTSNNDCIDGKAGNDKIAGLAGNDKLVGGDGKDLLVGGDGNDELTGGRGADKFQCGAGNDKITDFKASEGDLKTNDCEQF